jgi:hypothetical protein
LKWDAVRSAEYKHPPRINPQYIQELRYYNYFQK